MTNAKQVINIAAKEAGYQEEFKNGHFNNNQKYSDETPGLEWSDYMAWCVTFTCWVFRKAGLPKGSYPVTASCLQAVSWYKKNNRWSEYPAIGAAVFFGPGGGTHTGIVANYDDHYIYTIEGNTNLNGSAEGDGVYRKTRVRKTDNVYGYGYPVYSEGIVSADPEWASKNPVEKPPVVEKPLTPKFPGTQYFKVGISNSYVTHLDKLLVKTGFTKHKDGKAYEPGPFYSEWTKANVKDFQKAQGWTGYDADGLVGPETWKRLHKAAGYR